MDKRRNWPLCQVFSYFFNCLPPRLTWVSLVLHSCYRCWLLSWMEISSQQCDEEQHSTVVSSGLSSPCLLMIEWPLFYFSFGFLFLLKQHLPAFISGYKALGTFFDLCCIQIWTNTLNRPSAFHIIGVA